MVVAEAVKSQPVIVDVIVEQDALADPALAPEVVVE